MKLFATCENHHRIIEQAPAYIKCLPLLVAHTRWYTSCFCRFICRATKPPLQHSLSPTHEQLDMCIGLNNATANIAFQMCMVCLLYLRHPILLHWKVLTIYITYGAGVCLHKLARLQPGVPPADTQHSCTWYTLIGDHNQQQHTNTPSSVQPPTTHSHQVIYSHMERFGRCTNHVLGCITYNPSSVCRVLPMRLGYYIPEQSKRSHVHSQPYTPQWPGNQ